MFRYRLFTAVRTQNQVDCLDWMMINVSFCALRDAMKLVSVASVLIYNN